MPSEASPSTAAREGAAAVDRAMLVLSVIAEADRALSLAAVAAETGLYKSTILRLAASLQTAGLLQRRIDGRFMLGPMALTLGMRYQRQSASADILLPLMQDLATESGESVAFYVLSGTARLCVYRCDSPQALKYSIAVGARQPLDKGSGGRILAAFLAEDSTFHAAIRSRGYYHSDGERDPNVAGVSVPVFRPSGEVAGALTIAGPRLRFTAARVTEILPSLLATAARSTSALSGT